MGARWIDRRGVSRQIAAGHLGRRLGQHPGHVDGHVAIADDGDGGRIQVRRQVAEIRVAVVPADKGGGAIDPSRLRARNAHGPVQRRPGGQHHRIVEAAQLVQADIAAQDHVAEKAHPRRLGGAGKGAGDALGALMVGGDTGADQAERGRQGLDDIDPAVSHRIAARPRRRRSRWARHRRWPPARAFTSLPRLFRLHKPRPYLPQCSIAATRRG